jgi:nucleoside-diphosphate-sugar epimerase
LLRTLARETHWDVVGVSRRLPDVRRQPYDVDDWLCCDLGAHGAAGRLRAICAGADAVVHLAWAIQPTASDPPLHRTNVDGTLAVLQAVGDSGVPHLIHGSSVAAYTPAPRWMPVGEDWPHGGIRGSAYSRDKALAEQLIDSFAERCPGVTVSRIRPCAVVQHESGGQFGRWILSPIIPGSVAGHLWLPVPLWPALRGQIVHADDVANAIRLILAGRVSGAFNLAAERVLTSRALGDVLGGLRLPLPLAALKALAWPAWRAGIQPIHPGWFDLADRAPLVSTERAERELGWKAWFDAAEALNELVAGIRARAGGASEPLRPETHGPLRRLRQMGWGRPTHQTQSDRLRLAGEHDEH